MAQTLKSLWGFEVTVGALGKLQFNLPWGVRMTRNKPFLLTLLLASVSLAACSGLGDVGGGGGGCTSNCGGNTAGVVSVTLTASAPPASPALISFKVTITGVTLKNSSSGATANLVLSSSPTVELMRLQSDSAFYGSFSSVTAGTYDSAIVAISGPVVTFANNSGADINNANAACPNNTVCVANLPVANSPTITFPSPITVGTSGVGFSLNFNLTNAFSITNNALVVNFDTVTPVMSAVSLPRANSNLTGIQLDRIEDFVGVVSLNGSNVTVTSPVRGALTATANANTVFDSNPDVAFTQLCVTPGTLASCAQNGQIASIDAVLNSDGTLTLQEYEPLTSAAQDLLEGTVVSVSSLTQFNLVITDKNVAATNSIIGASNIGDGLTVTLSSAPPLQNFYVDTKGLAVEAASPGTIALFAGGTTTDVIKPGQTIAVHPTAFVGGSGSVLSTATVDKLTLRFSRFTSTAVAPSSPFSFNVSDLLPFFTGPFQVQTFAGTPGSQNGTNFDGVDNPASLTTGQPVAVRALFIENSTNNSPIPLFAAKVREP